MECSNRPPLTEEQLSAALDGDADPPTLEHLAGCASCAARLGEARRIERALKARLYRWDCPTPRQLGDYRLGLAAEATAQSIAAHLAGCALCAAELEQLRAFLRAAEAPPPSEPRRPARPAWRPLGALIARVQPAPALVMRGGASLTITAEVDDITILLDVQPADAGRVMLRGQVLDDRDQDRWIGALAELRQSGELRATAMLDDLGGFSCGPLPPEQAELRITPERGAAVVVPELRLESRDE